MARTKSETKPVFVAVVAGKDGKPEKWTFTSKTDFSRILLQKGANVVIDKQRLEDCNGFQTEKVIEYDFSKIDNALALRMGLALQNVGDESVLGEAFKK